MADTSVRVLVVDDQEPFRKAARLVVDLTPGFELVGEAATGEESVELARDLVPDLVLMDVNLPGIDGVEATRRILAEETRTRVLLVSTYEPDEYTPRALAAGAIGYVPKSAFGPDSLADAWSAGSTA